MSILFDQFGLTTSQATKNALFATCIDTPIGAMLAIGDDCHLYLLEFIDSRGFKLQIDSFKKTKAIYQGKSKPLESIEKELRLYFEGCLTDFKTPFKLFGSSFQQQVWQKLQTIPYGATSSYLSLSQSIDKPKAYRAVANANGANKLTIIIPCHRIIRANGHLCGYGGHPYRKAWLLEHEKRYSRCNKY